MMGLAAFVYRARLLADLMNACMPPPAVCGTKGRPHLVAPGGKRGDIRRCVTCGEIGTLP